MTTRHIPVSELPEVLRRALEACEYRARDVPVEVSETWYPGSAYGDGCRGVTCVVNLATGQLRREFGSWGGANPWERKTVDVARGPFPAVPGCVVIRGSSAWKRKSPYLTLQVHPADVAALLPAGDTDPLSLEERIALCIIRTIRGGARAEEWRRGVARTDVGLRASDEPYYLRGPGSYGAGNPVIESLAKRGYLKVNSRGSIQVTTKGRNADLKAGGE